MQSKEKVNDDFDMVFEDKNKPGPSDGCAAGNIAPGGMEFQQPNNNLDS